MSTRQEIWFILCDHMPEDEANKLIDDLLHEEAEKIREKRKNDEPMFPEEDQFMSGYESGLDDSADLIDPYAKGE